MSALIPAADRQRYAQLLLDRGLNLQAGQCLSISAEAVHNPLIEEITTLAYQRGARYVDVDLSSPRLQAIRAEHSPVDQLDFLPEYKRRRAQESAKERWCRLRIAGAEDPHLFDQSAGDKLAKMQLAEREASLSVIKAAQANELAWCVCASPTELWAAQVFGKEPSAQTSAALWQQMRTILRLDHEDPSATWAELAATLETRCQQLTDYGFQSIELQSAQTGTKLSVGLHPDGRWLGGQSQTPAGFSFIPNLPTEECFTTPDYRTLEGELAITRPVDILGKEVLEAHFRFEAGRVVEFHASKGLDALTELLAMDEQAVFAGELALVDNSSPIFQSGLTFHNILYDENATCHLALGSAYPDAVADASNWTSKKKLERGVNESLIHTDFMFGHDDLLVDGILPSGKAVALLREGSFVLEDS